jgi:hypothetical protein
LFPSMTRRRLADDVEKPVEKTCEGASPNQLIR